MSLVLDLRIAHDRVGSSADPTLNGHLKYLYNLDHLMMQLLRKYGNIVRYCEYEWEVT